MDPTVNEAALHQWSAVLWCQGTCRRGVPLDLLALQVGGKGDWPMSRVFKAARCAKCGGRPDSLRVDRMNIGKMEMVVEYRR